MWRRKFTHDEVYLVGQSEMIAYAPTLTAEDTDAMGLVDHDRAVVLVFQLNNLGQLCKVALHGEDTVDDNELDSFIWQLLQHTLQVFHVIVLVVQLAGKRKTATVHNTCVVTIVADDIVVLTHYHGEYALVDTESCGEAQTVVLADILRYFLLKLYVQVKGTIQETASGTPGAILVQCSLCCINDTLVTCQARISIRTEHQYLVTSHLYLCSLFALNGTEIGINVSLHVLLRLTIILVSFL